MIIRWSKQKTTPRLNSELFFEFCLLSQLFYDNLLLGGRNVPKLVLTIPETNENVTRPIILDVARQLFLATGLPENTAIYYPGDLEKAKQLGSTINPGEDQSNFR